ncbi:MAG: adenylate/guanylate cyclase domain-containing protein [Acidimicrobiales bacterium]
MTGTPRRRTSVQTRLALAVLAVSIGSLLVNTLVTLTAGEGSAEDELGDRLAEIGSATAEGVEGYFRATEAEVVLLAQSPMIIDGVQRFEAAHDGLPQLDSGDSNDATARLGEFYLDNFIPALEEVRGDSVPPSEVLPGRANTAALYLQDIYVASDLLREERALVTDGADGSTWTDVHIEFHPTVLRSVERLGFYDLYLIEPERRTIVYSTRKEIDFATSLVEGPHSNTPLARVVERVLQTDEPGEVIVSDFEPHAPSLDAPSAFLAAPIRNGSATVGVLAVQIDTAALNDLTTIRWRTEGQLGETGESYLVGDDDRMRSDSRLFLEDQGAFLAAIDDLGTVEPIDRARMISQGTTVLHMPVNNEVLSEALEGQDGVASTDSYLGPDVLTAYSPVQVGDLDWAILTEMERSELNAPIDEFNRNGYEAAAVIVAVLSFLALLWSTAFVQPIRTISASLKAVRGRDAEPSIPEGGPSEFRELARTFNDMIDNLATRERQVTEAADEKTALLARLLPAEAARAVGRGDRSLLEAVPLATVAVVVIDGLDKAVHDSSASENRELMHELVDELDDLAEQAGLERVKVLADRYFAACGLTAAHLDHAPRTVEFVANAQAAVRQIGADSNRTLDVRAGIHTGTVTVGLTGATSLVFDLWGEGVTTAYRLSLLAPPSEILVSTATGARLPPDRASRVTEVSLDAIPVAAGKTRPFQAPPVPRTNEGDR